MYRAFGKRLLDILIVLTAFVILSPLMVVVMVAIKAFDSGPIFFKQRRTGQYGDEFWFYKFRSMPVDTRNLPSDQIGQIELTWLGKLIRRTNLDELPQLFNVLKGNMSVVGPRPGLPSQMKLHELRRKNGAIELQPGITGLAQVNSYDDMPVVDKAEWDGQYAARLSFLLDLRIIFSTFRYLLKRPPKY